MAHFEIKNTRINQFYALKIHHFRGLKSKLNLLSDWGLGFIEQRKTTIFLSENGRRYQRSDVCHRHFFDHFSHCFVVHDHHLLTILKPKRRFFNSKEPLLWVVKNASFMDWALLTLN